MPTQIGMPTIPKVSKNGGNLLHIMHPHRNLNDFFIASFVVVFLGVGGGGLGLLMAVFYNMIFMPIIR